ncbi:threonylcarbamoyl-AMP synthase [Pusillimonas sp. CC-YST705]|uniref:Threonylcarbamoyl-AMP synthase n=1 Tax=Mesopusillimonas faecipullorum TaxID=2755040 RepID=A0ABS8CEV4_9BURK|nr:L-threonylcarbamoyladenylate synthase [Mesopusillimonas faecipullorum]MCB5364581.1 threonylcarbamoyl-AMP synthase [Mesopusillimonas faecipullorum]
MAAQLTDDIERAARRLYEGGLVAFPTETVYGLGADASNPTAVSQVYEAKHRPSGHPLIVHVAPGAALEDWAGAVPEAAHLLIEAFWPGPLTLILPRAERVSLAVTGGQASVGLRCPAHPAAQALLTRFAQLKQEPAGVVAPSANLFGQVSPTTAAHVLSEFSTSSHDILVLDGEPSEVGIESTIVDVSRLDQGMGPVLLRPGHVTQAQLETVLGVPVHAPDFAAPRVSGSLKAHYAPRTPLRVLPRSELLKILQAWPSQAGRVAVWCFDPKGMPASGAIDLAPAPTHPQAYARQLYAQLRALDETGNYACLLLEQPPAGAEWAGVADRLGRAAAAFE